jgi:tRNA pseudouridine38-40 synthase
MRYFLELSYKGTRYAGFQVQQNGDTIQGRVEKALTTICRFPINLTGSSRTDAGVHALQNFFHFDLDYKFDPLWIYNINALLPLDIVVTSVFPVSTDAHSRFLATSREYRYYITTAKNPFRTDTAWYYPFSVDINLLNQASDVLLKHTDFTSFSKRNTQVLTKECTIIKSRWTTANRSLIYTVEANRFLRGMVRGIVGTMLLVGRKKIGLDQFEEIIQAKDCTKASFATPAHGLFLVSVRYPFLASSNDNR